MENMANTASTEIMATAMVMGTSRIRSTRKSDMLLICYKQTGVAGMFINRFTGICVS